MRTIFLFVLATACGGAATPSPRSAQTAHHDDVVVTTSPVASSPPLFTGAFDLVKASDAKSSFTMADMVRALKAHDARMTWEFGASSFMIGTWSMSEPGKLADSDDPSTDFALFCRANGRVDAHWEGSTLVLASTLKASAAGAVVRIHATKRGNETHRTVTTRNTTCDASMTTTRIAFEILEKDTSGPTRIRGTSEGSTFELARSVPIESIDPSKIYGNQH